jgi:hypothetical protein
MNEEKRPNAGRFPQGEGAPELTDKELRELLAPVPGLQILTEEEENAAVARLQPAIRRRVRLDELNKK